jgi:hypothetical protein
MALTVNHPLLKETRVQISTTSIGGTPVACYVGMPIRGRITKISAVDQGAITTADCTVTVAVNGTTNAALGFTIPLTGAAAGRNTSATPTSAVNISEDDVLTFTPSGASGASIGCNFTVNVQMG